MIRRLLNFSTHPGEPELFDDDWDRIGVFLGHWGFDGFELYPVGDYPFKRIPSALMGGLHMRFFVILAPVWRKEESRLIDFFDSRDSAAAFYGTPYETLGPEWIADFYAGQLDLAQRLDCGYVVFHPVHCELAHVYDWRFPWRVEDTLDMCAEVINAATARSKFKGRILFENLWWPGSFRLLDPREYEYLRSRVNYSNCGIALDTGHLMNTNPDLTSEPEAVDFLLGHMDAMGETKSEIYTVHLTRSLSGKYIHESRKNGRPDESGQSFWEKFDTARRHVGNIDQHEPFTYPGIAEVLEKIEPENVVFEFTFTSIDQWEEKIVAQKKALNDFLWPDETGKSVDLTSRRER